MHNLFDCTVGASPIVKSQPLTTVLDKRGIVMLLFLINAVWICQVLFLQRYTKRCISYDRFCLTVRPSQSGIMPKRLQLWSCRLHCRIAPWL